MMKAVRFHDYGPPEVLRYEEAPKPEPGPGEVLVRVHATSFNPIDAVIRAGYFREVRKDPLPFTPGWDFSGVVEDLGEGVATLRVGDEVLGHPRISGGGTYADYVAVPAEACTLKPADIDHEHAAAIPLAALTAWQALFEHTQLTAGQTVLIHGGAGGVGTFAIQFAKHNGLRVAATASGRNQELLKELGADLAINYETTRFEDVLPDKVDAVIEGLAGEIRTRSWTVLKPGCPLIALIGAPPTDQEATAAGFKQQTMWVHPSREQLTEIVHLVDTGAVRVILDSVVPLREAAEVHRAHAQHHARGKTVLKVR